MPFVLTCLIGFVLQRCVAFIRRTGQYGVDPELVCHLDGSLLGHNGSFQLSGSDDTEESRLLHRACVGVLICHQLPGHRLVAGSCSDIDSH